MFQTARRRLVAWNVLVVTLILGVLGVVFFEVFSATIYSGVDGQLRGQEQKVIATVDRAGDNPYALFFVPNSPFDPAYRTVLANPQRAVNQSTDCPPMEQFGPSPPCPPDSMKPTDPDGLRAAITPEAIAKGGDIRTSSQLRGQPERVLSFAVVSGGSILGIFQISRTVLPEQNALHEVHLLLILGGLLGIILAGLGSLFLANRALVPIGHAFARQRQFTADASHELRTPLALIRANAEMMCRHGERLPPGDGELAGEIIRETDHLNRLVSDLLTLARADSDQVEISTRPVDLRALVSEVHEDVHRIAESRGIGSEISLDGPAVVDGDETRLRQLLLILMDNALKYTDAGGSVDVSLRCEDSRARLLVSDTGIGIPAKDLPHIFDRFYRVDRAREHESGGTGLGLAIARWIIQVHRGTVKVESELGRGTRFQIELPTA